VAFLRGNIYFSDFATPRSGPKPWLAVSNDRRNQRLGSALVVRITTTPKSAMGSIVELAPGDPVVGRVLCDTIAEIWDDDPARHAGALTPATMRRVGEALKVVLSL
jgi:mRNA interferase MazF